MYAQSLYAMSWDNDYVAGNRVYPHDQLSVSAVLTRVYVVCLLSGCRPVYVPELYNCAGYGTAGRYFCVRCWKPI